MPIQRLYEKTVVKGNTPKELPPLPRTYRGFSTISQDSENYSLFDLSLIKQDIINHFHIKQGEKLSDPTFGTIIWDCIFEPMTEDLKELVIKDVERIINYDPRVTANDVVITEYESGLQIECELTYLPYNVSEVLRFRFDQNAGLVG
jgi:phage baseplate assembly protein W